MSEGERGGGGENRQGIGGRGSEMGCDEDLERAHMERK